MSPLLRDMNDKPGHDPNFRKTVGPESRSEKAILGTLGKFWGILGATIRIQEVILGIPFSEWRLMT